MVDSYIWFALEQNLLGNVGKDEQEFYDENQDAKDADYLNRLRQAHVTGTLKK